MKWSIIIKSNIDIRLGFNADKDKHGSLFWCRIRVAEKKFFFTFATSPQEEALTPMANLKMLIRVASETDQVPILLNVFLRHWHQSKVS